MATATVVARESITVPGEPVNARNPHLTRIGDFIFSSGIYGRGLADGTTGVYVPGLVGGDVVTDPEVQVVRTFEALVRYIEAAGLTNDNVALVTVHVRDESLKPLVYREWDKVFGANGPAGHVIVPPSFLDPNTHVALDFIARAGTTRENFVVDGEPRYGSLPHAVRLGDIVYLSGLNGRDLVDNPKGEQNPALQMVNAHRRVNDYITAAGSNADEIGFLRNYVRYRNNREIMNPEFKKLFGEKMRAEAPARSTHVQPNLPYTLELEIANVTAVAGATQEGAYAASDWVRPHAEPISDTAKRGNVLFSSRVAGREQADGTNEERIEIQIAKSFESLAAHVEAAGGSLDTIGRVDVWVDGLAAKFLHDREWDRLFPDPAKAPAQHIHHQSEGLVPGWHHRMEFTAFVL